MLYFFIFSANGKWVFKKVKTDVCGKIFPLSFFYLLTRSSQPSSSPYLTLAKKAGTALPAQEEGREWIAAGQTRLGGLRAFRVKAGYGYQPWVHGPERKARHSSWKSGQAGTEWEQKQEGVWNKSSGKKTGLQRQRLICLAARPELWGWIGLLETWGHRRQTTPFLLCLQPNHLGLWSRQILYLGVFISWYCPMGRWFF